MPRESGTFRNRRSRFLLSCPCPLVQAVFQELQGSLRGDRSLQLGLSPEGQAITSPARQREERTHLCLGSGCYHPPGSQAGTLTATLFLLPLSPPPTSQLSDLVNSISEMFTAGPHASPFPQHRLNLHPCLLPLGLSQGLLRVSLPPTLCSSIIIGPLELSS